MDYSIICFISKYYKYFNFTNEDIFYKYLLISYANVLNKYFYQPLNKFKFWFRCLYPILVINIFIRHFKSAINDIEKVNEIRRISGFMHKGNPIGILADITPSEIKIGRDTIEFDHELDSLPADILDFFSKPKNTYNNTNPEINVVGGV